MSGAVDTWARVPTENREITAIVKTEQSERENSINRMVKALPNNLIRSPQKPGKFKTPQVHNDK